MWTWGLALVVAFCVCLLQPNWQGPKSEPSKYSSGKCLTCNPVRYVTSFSYLNIYVSHKPPTFLTGCIFFLMILLTSDNVVVGSLSPGSAYLYIEIVIWVSLFIGIWALFVFFRMTVTHQTLNHHRYKAKVIVYKLVLLFTNIEGSTFFVIHSQLRHGEANCNWAMETFYYPLYRTNSRPLWDIQRHSLRRSTNFLEDNGLHCEVCTVESGKPNIGKRSCQALYNRHRPLLNRL